MGKKLKGYACKVCGLPTGRNEYVDRYCPKCHLELFELNFNEIAPSGKYLTYNGFNKITKSTFKSKKYVTFFKRNFPNMSTWYDVLVYFNKDKEIFEYMCDEFKKFSIENNNENIKKFLDSHEFALHNIANKYGYEYIKKACGMGFVKDNSKEDILIEYNRIKTELNHVPSYNEFVKLAMFSLTVINGRYNGYEDFIKTESPEDLSEFRSKRKIEQRSRSTVFVKGDTLLTNEELFSKVSSHVHDYFDKYKELPPVKVLEKIYSFDMKHFRKRMNIGYEDFVESIGYNKEQLSGYNRSEKSCLKSISDLLSTHYLPQQTFPWLIGCKNFPLFCDGYYPEYNLVVEFNGVQHYKPIEKFGGLEMFKIVQQNDSIKEKLCKEHGLNFVIIKSCQPWYKEEWLIKHLAKYGMQKLEYVV